MSKFKPKRFKKRKKSRNPKIRKRRCLESHSKDCKLRRSKRKK